MKTILQKQGYEVVEWKCPVDGNYNKCAEVLYKLLDSGFYGVLMYNYIPQFSRVCNEKKIYYITWVVDCPHFALYSKTITLPYNRIFLFDRIRTQQMIENNIEHVYHLPLGTDIEFWQQKVKFNNAGEKRFKHQVSFVGNLYNGKDRNLYRQVKYLPPYIKGFMEGLCQTQMRLQENIPWERAITEEVWQEIRKWIDFTECDEYIDFYQQQIINMLKIEITARERCTAVSYLNQHFDFGLYTGSDTSFDPAIEVQGYINYETEMPVVFAQSDININITSRAIYSGTPLRILDIMACGGFVMTNYKAEIGEAFRDGEECVIYYGLNDLLEKTAFYLQHEEVRKKIAMNGYNKTARDFSLERQLNKMKRILEAEE